MLLFLLVFGPKTLVAQIDFLSLAAFTAILVYLRYSVRALGSLDLWLTGLAGVYTLLILVLTSTPDGWWILKAPRTLINYVAVFLLTTHILERYGRNALLRMFHDTVFLHAVIVLAMAFIPPFRDLISGLFGGVTKSLFQISGLTRGLALTAIVMMFPFVTYPLFRLSWDYRERGIYLKLGTILVATLFMGRTGLYLDLGVGVILVLVVALRSGYVVAAGGFLLAALLSTWELFRFAVEPEDSLLGRLPFAEAFRLPVLHMLEPFVNLWYGRGFTARSIEHIQSMPVVYANDSFLEYLFGTGLYGRGDPFTYLPTDVAYLHMFSAFGAVGLTIFVLAMSVPLAQYFHCARSPVYWCLFAIIAVVLIANVKETALFTRHLYTVHVLFVAWIAHESQLRERETGTSRARADGPIELNPGEVC